MYNLKLASLILIIITALTISSTSAYDFIVGFSPNPRESYNNWSGRMRFQINDKLVFRYNKTSDSVLVVNKQDYDSCNTNSPIQKLDGGDSTFQFNRSGPFYFISGVADRCSNGEKLIVVVLADRSKKSPPPSPSPPAPTPAPSNPPSSPPSPSPETPSPTPTPTPESPGAPPTPTPTPESPGAPPTPTPTPESPGAPPSSVSPAPAGDNVAPPPPPPAGPKPSAASRMGVGVVGVGLVLAHAILG